MRRLLDVLSAEGSLAGLLDRCGRELAVLEVVQKLLPETLACRTSVADASHSDLVLAALSGAAATLLRHRTPELLDALAREGWKFTGIRVRVQARSTPSQRAKVYAKQMDDDAAATLLSGAQRIADPALAAAVCRLAEAGRGSSEGKQRALKRVEDEHPEQKK